MANFLSRNSGLTEDWLAKPENWGLVGILLKYLLPPSRYLPPLLSTNNLSFRISLKTLELKTFPTRKYLQDIKKKDIKNANFRKNFQASIANIWYSMYNIPLTSTVYIVNWIFWGMYFLQLYDFRPFKHLRHYWSYNINRVFFGHPVHKTIILSYNT